MLTPAPLRIKVCCLSSAELRQLRSRLPSVRTQGRLDLARLRAFVAAARGASRPSSPAA